MNLPWGSRWLGALLLLFVGFGQELKAQDSCKASPLSIYDLNHSGKIDGFDLSIFAAAYNQKGVRPEDFNADKIVDFSDLLLLAQNFNKSVPAPSCKKLTRPSADFNGNCVVEDNDIATVLSAYRKGGTLSSEDQTRFDLNNDGILSAKDLSEAVAQIDARCREPMKVIDSTNFRHQEAVADVVAPNKMIGFWNCDVFAGGCSENLPINEPRLREVARAYKDQNREYVFFDIETLSYDPSRVGLSTATANLNKVIRMVDIVKNEFSLYKPDQPSPQTCHYSIAPRRDFWGPQNAPKARLMKRLLAIGLREQDLIEMKMIPSSPGYLAWHLSMLTPGSEYLVQEQQARALNDFLKPLANAVDALCPSLYVFYTPNDMDPNARQAFDDMDWGYWIYARENLAEARRLAPTKPIHSFLMPRYHDSRYNEIVADPVDEFGVPKNHTRRILESLHYSGSNSVAVWDYDESGATSWQDFQQRGFYQGLKAFYENMMATLR